MASSEVTDEPPTLIKEDLLPLSAQVIYLILSNIIYALKTAKETAYELSKYLILCVTVTFTGG